MCNSFFVVTGVEIVNSEATEEKCEEDVRDARLFSVVHVVTMLGLRIGEQSVRYLKPQSSESF